MSSKLNVFVIMGLFAFISAGCGLKFGEETPKEDVAELESTQCLDQALDELKIYFKGNATTKQVDHSMDCLAGVFKAFKDNIRGEDRNSYTPKEIATFVEQNFLKDSNTRFRDEFLAQIMNFKVALFGGDNKAILKSEIDSLIDLLVRMKPYLHDLNPHMKVITFRWEEQLGRQENLAKEKKFKEAKAEFNRFLYFVAREFAGPERRYKIDDAMGLIAETARFVKVAPSTIEKIEKAIPFIKRFKLYLIGGLDSLKGDEWERMALTLNEAYFQTLRIEYFYKELNDNQVAEKWMVYEKIGLDVTSLLEKLLAARETRILLNAEIADLVQPLKEIFPQADLSLELLNELGELKIVLLGESAAGRRGWAQTDFVRLNAKLPELFAAASIIAENLELIQKDKNFLLQKKISYEQFEKSEIRIIEASYKFVQLIEKQYDLNSLKRLLIELSRGPFSENFKLPDNFEQLFSVGMTAKESLTGEAGPIISENGLKLLINTGVRGYLNYREYELFIDSLDFNTEAFASTTIRLWSKVKVTLTNFLNLKPKNVLSTDEITQLILSLQSNQFIDTELKAKSIKSAIDSLWTHILNPPENRLAQKVLPGFNIQALEQFESEALRWLKTHRAATRLFADQVSIPAGELRRIFIRLISNEKDVQTKESLQELVNLLSDDLQLTFNDMSYLEILERKGRSAYRMGDVVYSNIGRALGRLLIRSYALDAERINSLGGVTEVEAQVAYDQLKPLAVDLDAVDESNVGFVKSRFLEASLFLSESDGDKTANMKELHGLVLHIISGLARSSDLKEDIVQKCLPPVQGKITSTTKVWEECLLGVYATNQMAFSGLPEYINLRNQVTPAEMKEYNLNLLKAAGHKPNEGKTVLMSDANLFPHVVQYVEMVYSRHDYNYNQLIEKDEALRAFPVFKELLKELVKPYKQLKESDLEGVFVYILKYGRPPRKESISEVLKFITFIRDPLQKEWNIQSNRLQLGKIFNYIAESTSVAPAADADKNGVKKPSITVTPPPAVLPVPVTSDEPPVADPSQVGKAS